MEIQKYLEIMNEIYNQLLELIIEETKIDNEFEHKLSYFKIFLEDRQYLIEILQIINEISNNHHRVLLFFSKIEKIISFFQNKIQENLTNSQIFHIFKSNKRIILYLIKQKILTIDQSIYEIFQNDKSNLLYFYPELKSFIDSEIIREMSEYELDIIKESETSINEFDEKRLKGENDTEICRYIQTDSVKNFISHVNRWNIKLSNKIQPSIFESNFFLIDKKPSIIEYCAFFGSIEIFKYLLFNNVELTPSLWIYAIHGKQPEIIHTLEDNQIKPSDSSLNEILYESIKCHHNDIVNYILINLIQNETNNHFIYGILSHNYNFYPTEINEINKQNYFYYFCESNQIKLFEFLLNNNNIDINYETKSINGSIFNLFYFIYKIPLI